MQGYHRVSSLCESERERLYDDDGEKGKSRSTIIFMVFTAGY